MIYMCICMYDIRILFQQNIVVIDSEWECISIISYVLLQTLHFIGRVLFNLFQHFCNLHFFTEK